jgi:hypothetical protein
MKVVMKKWLRTIRDAVGMGLAWAAGWGFVGLLTELSIEFLAGLPTGVRESLAKALDPWPALALPGVIGGVVCSTVLWITEGCRGFDELSAPRCGAWGAVVGVLMRLFPVATVATGLARVYGDVDLWLTTAVIIGPVVLLSAVSGVGSGWLFRCISRERAPISCGR